MCGTCVLGAESQNSTLTISFPDTFSCVCSTAVRAHRLPTYSGRHYPTAASMWRGTMITSAKVWAACLLLKWTGKSRQAAALQNGFKAFLVQNTPGCVVLLDWTKKQLVDPFLLQCGLARACYVMLT